MPQEKHLTTILIIMDGWGIADIRNPGNAINKETAPNYFSWLKKFPHTELLASGSAVGLFKGQEGNSEAGHMNLGAGRMVKQDVLYISEAITDGTFIKNNAFLQAIHHVKKYNTAVHLMGLLSNHNSAHSCPEHLFALLDLFHAHKVNKVYLHLFTDGRDSNQHDAVKYLKKLEAHFHGTEKIASIMGRFYAMDRNKDWGRVKMAFEAIVNGKAAHQAKDANEALTEAYNRGETDEFIKPTVLSNNGNEPVQIKDNDAIFFFNLRSDRARELTKAFVQPDFETINPGAFIRQEMPKNIRFVALTDFGPDLGNVLTAFPSRDVKNSLTQVLCPNQQLYIAESEKFAHVTYFFNGGYANPLCNEVRVKIPSPHVDNYAEKPEMSAKAVSQHVIKAIESKKYSFICVNFANPDMVGHTGNFAAGKIAMQTVDREADKVLKTLLANGGQGIITADHGNIEEMINLKTGEIDTEHSVNPVPCILVGTPLNFRSCHINKNTKLRRGSLADVAPTLLKMMGLEQPPEMTSKPLF